MCQGKMKFCKNVRNVGILHFNLMKLECLVPMYLFFAKFIFSAPVLSGKFDFVSGKCQGIVREFWSVQNV